MKKIFMLPALAGLALLTATLAVQRVPQPPMFCDQCVMAHEVTEWRLAGRWTLWIHATDSATPVSDLLAAHSACPAHPHHWTPTVRVAETDLETTEAPRLRTVGFLNAPRNVAFLRSVFDFADAKDIASWRAVAWQPTLAAAMDDALRFSRFPENGFASRGEFLAWWGQHSYPLFNKLNEMTVAD